ncbi:MAG TPA: hypothetical protein VNT30_04140, partial [Stellaceae bacterium]|nr:hypothetical protein [Stellaceae bacterium]
MMVRTMRRASFTEEQIIGLLRENEAGAKADESLCKHGGRESDLSQKAEFCQGNLEIEVSIAG